MKSSDDSPSKDSATPRPIEGDLWVKEAKQLSPKSKVVTLQYFESFAP